MPGKKSLEIREYYAHPGNAFWYNMLTLFDYDYTDNYSLKVGLLRENKLALWDSLAYCEREGSLDASIKHEKANDLASFLRKYPGIKTICFNGQAAYRYFTKYHKPEIGLNI